MSTSVEPSPPEPKLAGPQLLETKAVPAYAVGLALLMGIAGYGFIGGASMASRGDRISADEAARLAADFGRAKGSLMPVDSANKGHRDNLMAALRLPSSKAAQLVAMVESGERALGWLTLWDNFDQDGDVVSVTAAGFRQVVPLTHAPTRVLIPYVPGQPVYVTGERDGGGGITVAVELSSGPLPLPPLAVGQTIALPIQ
jgi:hypothetical protein